MIDSNLKCVIKENSNVVKIFADKKGPAIKHDRHFMKKANHPDSNCGRWTNKEQLAFIESMLIS